MSITILNIITPFKNDTLVELKKTVDSLLSQKFLFIKHIVVCDKSSYINTKKYLEFDINPKTNYKYFLMISRNKGIYSSINQGLESLKESDPYLVLGAGDILNIYSNIFLNEKNRIFSIPYSLSSKSEILIKKFRSIFMGMPYCHNALIFRKNYLKYDQKYNLSADYDYFLNYIFLIKGSRFVFNQERFINEVKGCSVIFDDQNGLSSKQKEIVHLQNLQIIFRKYFLLGLIIYLVLNLKKFFLKLKK